MKQIGFFLMQSCWDEAVPRSACRAALWACSPVWHHPSLAIESPSPVIKGKMSFFFFFLNQRRNSEVCVKVLQEP